MVLSFCVTHRYSHSSSQKKQTNGIAAIGQMAVCVTNARLIAAGDRGKSCASLMGDGRWWHSAFAVVAAVADASALFSCSVYVGPSTENEDDFNRGTNLSNYYHYHRLNVNSKYKLIESKWQDHLSKQRGEESATHYAMQIKPSLLFEKCDYRKLCKRDARYESQMSHSFHLRTVLNLGRWYERCRRQPGNCDSPKLFAKRTSRTNWMLTPTLLRFFYHFPVEIIEFVIGKFTRAISFLFLSISFSLSVPYRL